MKPICAAILGVSLFYSDHAAMAQGGAGMALQAATGLPAVEPSPSTLTVLLFLAITAGLFALIARLVDVRRQRAEQAAVLEVRISGALEEDPIFLRSSVGPTVHVPFWRGSPARIEMRGHVASPLLEASALRIAVQAAARVRADFSVHSCLTVISPSGFPMAKGESHVPQGRPAPASFGPDPFSPLPARQGVGQ